MALSAQLILAVFTIGGSVFGAYLGVRVAVARLEERSLATDATLRHLLDRIERLEGIYFVRGN